MNTNTKKILAIIICVLVAFIPTYIAIANYLTTQTSPVRENTVDKLEIITPDGKKYEILKEQDTDGFIEAMVSANSSAEKVLALPDPLLDNTPFEFTYHSYNKATTYKYHFSKQSSDAYMVDPNGMAFHVLKSDAERFLKTQYAYGLYDNSTAPSMIFDTKTVQPQSADWQFKGYNGEFYNGFADTAESAQFQTYGTPVISFDIEPDSLNIVLKSGDEVVYDGYYSELANQDFGGQTLDAAVTASWYESEDRNYRGELYYQFSIQFKKQPMFFISSKTATIGDVLALSVLYADNASDINFKCEPALSNTPVFVKDGDYMRALIPVSTAEIPGKYTISVDYLGHSPTEFAVDISGRFTAMWPYNVDEALLNSLYTDTNIKAYKDLFNSFFKDAPSERKFDGSFISGLPAGTYESADYGDLLTIGGNDVSFENPGLYYTCYYKSDVKAVNAGTVIYAGHDELAGDMVAIDHGMGLVSIYKHLDSIVVAKGDTVEKSTILAKSGRTGLISKKKETSTLARVELYVNGVPVDITPLISSGIALIK